jgi:hypothetical protein
MATKKAKKKTVGTNDVCVRMYRHGLGDCFLVRFPLDSGEGTFNVLIDCGIIGVAKDPKPTMQRVVADIAQVCNNHLDVVIVTHEHWDHASGFSTQQAQADFDEIDIDSAWYAWTEDPESQLGRKLYRERAAKLKALGAAAAALGASQDKTALDRSERVMSLLNFFGMSSVADLGAAADGVGKTRAAFEYLKKRRGVKTVYCYPDKAPQKLKGVSGVRVYVLGPPQDEGMIKRSSPTRKGKEVYEMASDLPGAENLEAAFLRMGSATPPKHDIDCPFDGNVPAYWGAQPTIRSTKLQDLMSATWDNADEVYRKLDMDWTAAAEALALNLDSNTNNTCLVVAFELVESGQVLLFAADAQVGNWLSWQGTHWRVTEAGETRSVTGPELLERTVFYKVGHHGSHNATLRDLGLEQMASEDLIAFVPVFKEQAEKNRWHGMPFKPLVKRLKEKTGGRLVFSDPKQKAPTAADLKNLPATQRNAFLKGLVEDDLFYEYTFEL